MRKPLQCIVIFALLTAPAIAGVVCDESEDFIVIRRDGHHVLTYNKTDSVPDGVDPKFARSGFIHPISTPAGKILTDGYPIPHHTHQHGLFFAWKKATFEGEEANFWEHTPTGANVRHSSVLEIINVENFAGFRVRLVHTLGAEDVLHEIWTVRVRADSGFIEFKSEQSCATDSPLVIQKYHYGALAIRGARQWFDLDFEKAESAARREGQEIAVPEPCQILTSEGHTRATGNHTRPEWVCMTGPIDGDPVAMTFFPHPSNFRHPQHVRLHPSMPYFCFIPTVEDGFRLEPGKPLVSRFRILAEDGSPDVTRLKKIQAAYASDPTDELQTKVLIGESLPDGERDQFRVTPGKLHSPFGVDFDSKGTMTIVELKGGRVHQLSKEGKFTTIAGDGSEGYTGDGGLAKDATFNGMHNLAISATDDIYIADSWNHCIRKIDAKTGIISTFAGTGRPGFSGDGGPANEAMFDFIMCISFNASKDALYLADLRNRRVRKIDLASGIVTTIAGNGEKGVPVDGAQATASPLVDPRAVAVDSKGVVYVLERGGHTLRAIGLDGEIKTVLGTGKAGYKDGPALSAQINGPKHLCVDQHDRLIIADEQNQAIRLFSPATGQVHTILGRGGIGNPPRFLAQPHGVCVHDEKLVVVDTGHHRILIGSLSEGSDKPK